MHKLYIVAQK